MEIRVFQYLRQSGDHDPGAALLNPGHPESFWEGS